MSRYHIKYFNDRTLRTDNLTIDYSGPPAAAVNAFLHDHPDAECVYQVFEQVPIRSSVLGHRFRVDVGRTARVVEAHDAKEAAEAVEAQIHKPPRRVWKLRMRRAGNGQHNLVEAA